MNRDEYRSSALEASALNTVVGGLVAALIARSNLPLWPIAIFAASGVLGLAVLLPWRHPPRAVNLAVINLTFATGLLAPAVTTRYQITRGEEAEVFESLKFGLFVIALIAPSVRLGLFWIAAYVATPFFLAMELPAGAQALLPLSEPWVTAVYALAAAGILVYRRRYHSMRVELTRTRAEKAAAERLARLSLALRDLSNSPLQTLSTGLSLLTDPGHRVLVHMEHALKKLRAINQTLAKSDDAVSWRGSDSFDAQRELDGALRRLD
jgi:hypothetical protein